MAQLIDGKAFAASLRNDIAEEVAKLHQQGITPGLAVILVGEDPASQVYVRNKGKQTIEVGMSSFVHKLPESTSQTDLLALINKLNNDNSVQGILVQIPLPDHIDADTVINAIDPRKDVDGFHPVNVGRFSTGGNGTIPCTPLGCLMLLKDQLGDLSGARALVLGRSNIVGKPMSTLLLNENCTVTTAHSRTKDLQEECRRADILIVAVGRPEMVKGSWIKPGATVIDVGINRIEQDSGKARLVGDVQFSSAAEVAGAITPVPGGVGPMTIACLLLNTLTAALRQNDLPIPTWIPTQN
ncbi:bifunctional methylenetetrahydrofolate dehydrogenase/methenyltetrahydrofolate cyclohydrolase FolD [Amphritea balenae]|uniref:Bifunctional protein FolD n=1 Tax=Amphritea balenae TaxID=452629 RepID=A0A3P1SII5_9GAMM|nr:bifunctional methylenetetrahydrofolate dehydrogenase/methenyltetrahydrofolate cyclohydrolase FolD [Amphritea balenae]RRC97101.1 bifunctional methylenetetrahydrofolate dehydrogenase/methenyltetrahydrofolate cyclohydrolase FolD [Amphritea balenae]GGK68025.1 bifunctional protein FolD [Amphritea balenae]